MQNNHAHNSTQNISKIKIDSIHLEILYRSLYILKKKFEKFKKEINSIYIKYYPEQDKPADQNDFPIIKIVNFFPLLQDIFEKIKITIPRIHDINTLFNYDISKFDKNSKEHLESIKLMEKTLFSQNKKELIKYNSKFYSKKIEPIVDYFVRKGNGDDLTEIKLMTEYDRKGRIINTFGKLLESIGIKSNFKLITKNPKDEYNSNVEKGDILYIEILPIILADFLQENNDFVVINLDNEDFKLISDIKNRFDDNLQEKIKNNKNLNIFHTYNENKSNNATNLEKLNLSPEEQKKLCENKKYKLEKNIKFYQKLLFTKKKKGESYNYITDFISKMNKEKERLEKEIKQLTLKVNALILEEQKVERKKEKKIKTAEEKLQEIFHFYCSQHSYQSPSPTFDQIEFKVNHMNISEFCKFCTEFKIPIGLDKLMEIYNKRNPLLDTSEINFNEFMVILEKISVLMNQNKINKMKKKIEKLNKKMKGLEVSIDSDEEITNNSDIKILSSKSEQYKKNIEQLKSLNNVQIFNEFKKFLEIDKPSKKIKDKMKGFLFKYWDDNEKIERRAPLTREEYQRVKKKVQIFKSIREKSAKEKESEKEKLKQELYDKKKEEFLINNKKLVKKIKDKEEKKSYILLKNLNIRKKNKVKEKFSLETIKSNTYEGIANSNMNLNKEEKEEIFVDDDEENSDDELFKKVNNVNKKKEDDLFKEEKIEDIMKLKINLKKDENNIKEKNENLINVNLNNNVNNSRNITNTNDNLSSSNTLNTNVSNEIKVLKMNLKPKKKENIYFSFNNINGIKDITEEMKQKDLDKKNEENNVTNNDTNNNTNNKKDGQRYQEFYKNIARLNNNEFKKSFSPLNININNNFNNNNKKRPIGIYKNQNITKDISSIINKNINKKEDKINHLDNSFNKDKIALVNKSIDMNNKNKNMIDSSESKNKNKIFIQINDFNIKNENNDVKNSNKNSQIIQLPSLSGTNINTFGNHNETNRNTAHFKESKESYRNNINATQPNNNIIVLPSINSPRYNLSNKEKPSSPSFQKNSKKII